MFGHKKESVVVRMPPSPTGYLHLGNVRTLLFNYLFAKKHGGVIVFRSEDTDAARGKKEYEETNMDDLTWLGLSWDDFYRQSERAPIYRKYLEMLVEKNAAYLSKEESKINPGEMIEVVRLHNPNKEIVFEDVVHGEISFDTSELGDLVIARSLDDALYHFTVVVDDHEMGVTHVIRGDDHISNTPRQILLQEALGFERPVYAHLPIILGPDKSKLSKRHGSVSLHQFRKAGYLPEALVNYLALLGWNPGTDQELFTLDELIQEFDLEGVQLSAAMFNLEKLKWFNKEYLRKFPDNAYSSYVLPWLSPHVEHMPQYSNERVERLLPTIKERVPVGEDIAGTAKEGEYDFAFQAPEVNLELLKWKNDKTIKDTLGHLQQSAEILSMIPDKSDIETIKAPLFRYAEQAGKGEVLWPLRVALTGKERSPDPFTVIYIIGTAEAYKRVKQACDTILSA